MEKIVNNEELMQVELYEDGQMLGHVEYFEEPELLYLTLVFVEPEFRGQGLAKRLAKVAYDFAKQVDKDVKITCSVLNGIISSDPSYDDLRMVK